MNLKSPNKGKQGVPHQARLIERSLHGGRFANRCEEACHVNMLLRELVRRKENKQCKRGNSDNVDKSNLDLVNLLLSVKTLE